MTAEQLDAIEEALGFPLPAEYRRIASEQPFRPIRDDHVYWFFDGPEAVIDETLHPQAAGAEELPRLPIGSVAIGYSAGGDTYVLDARAKGLPVHCLSHETLEIEPEYPSFQAFVAEWLDAPARVVAEVEAGAALAAAEYRARMRRARWIILLCSLPFIAWLLVVAVIAWLNGRG